MNKCSNSKKKPVKKSVFKNGSNSKLPFGRNNYVGQIYAADLGINIPVFSKTGESPSSAITRVKNNHRKE